MSAYYTDISHINASYTSNISTNHMNASHISSMSAYYTDVSHINASYTVNHKLDMAIAIVIYISPDIRRWVLVSKYCARHALKTPIAAYWKQLYTMFGAYPSEWMLHNLGAFALNYCCKLRGNRVIDNKTLSEIHKSRVWPSGSASYHTGIVDFRLFDRIMQIHRPPYDMLEQVVKTAILVRRDDLVEHLCDHYIKPNRLIFDHMIMHSAPNNTTILKYFSAIPHEDVFRYATIAAFHKHKGIVATLIKAHKPVIKRPDMLADALILNANNLIKLQHMWTQADNLTE